MNIILESCLRAAQLLLWLFILAFLGCSSLKSVEGKEVERGESILQLSVNENDFVVFNQRIQALGLVAEDFRPLVTNVSGDDHNEFWITIRFPSEDELMEVYVDLMSNGSLRRISYSYQK